MFASFYGNPIKAGFNTRLPLARGVFDPLVVSGTSTGSAVSAAVGFAAVAYGTESEGSIVRAGRVERR
jgi:Asp-tRNA(Asn)/Glu-tRNA(Gln) amidotransferase A subunit family amidase